jgi:hypothetical protein
MENYKNLSWDNIEAMYTKTDKLITRLVLVSEKARQESKKLDARLEKMYIEARQESKEADKRLKELGKHLGGISNSNGELAEEYFYNALKADKTFVNEKFNKTRRNLVYKRDDKEAEFDIVLFNSKSAVLIEVKYNAKPENISKEKIISRIEYFKLLYPECKNFNFYLGVAAMSFKKSLEAKLHQAGIATIRPVGKKMVKFDKDVKVF